MWVERHQSLFLHAADEHFPYHRWSTDFLIFWFSLSLEAKQMRFDDELNLEKELN